MSVISAMVRNLGKDFGKLGADNLKNAGKIAGQASKIVTYASKDAIRSVKIFGRDGLKVANTAVRDAAKLTGDAGKAVVKGAETADKVTANAGKNAIRLINDGIDGLRIGISRVLRTVAHDIHP